ncbi:MAG TPA: type II toxin-antitoxin system RelE/ParE family toxin [Opitutaceae bacterium]|nr:type II toxin-antitoxin system RelE/ParE family toxin [Opitutaceae bacterium]
MSLRLIVAPQAEDDLRDNFVWYEKRAPGLGFAFVQSVEAKLEGIANSPQIFRKRVGPYRLAATRRFPYVIYFIWDATSAVITIRRILHFKQDRRPRLRG